MGKKARLITFEGGEGAGKTTQMKRVARLLRQQGHSVVLTREPGGGGIADKIRDFLLSDQLRGIVPLAELFLYEASRAQHVEKKIVPALRNNKIVLCDRYIDSSVVYQGVARGLAKKQIELLNHVATQGIVPDLTLVFDLDPVIGRKRIGKRAALDRLEKESLAFHRKVRQGFLLEAKRNKKRCILIDASRDSSTVFRDIKRILQERKLV